MNIIATIEKKTGVNFGASKIAIFYLLIGSSWILFSDKVAAALAPDTVTLTRISTLKGWGFVIVTASLLYWLIKRHTVAVQESEKRYRTLIEQASDGIFLANRDQQYIEVNSALCSLLGYTREEILQLTMSDITKLSLEGPLRMEELQDGKIFLIEREIFRKDGRLVSVEISARQLPNGSYQGIVRDITVRKQAGIALQESERFAHATVDALSAHIAILDESGMILAVNHAWRVFSEANSPKGSDLKVYEGVNYLSVCEASSGPNSEEAPAIVAGIHAVMSGKQNKFSLEYPCHSPDEKRWFIARVTRFPGEGAMRIVVAHENITKRLRAEEALAASEARLRVLFASMQDVVLVIDREGVYREIAPTNPELLVRSPDELLGKNLRDVFSADQAESFLCTIQQVLEKQQTADIEYELVINARPLWFDTSISPMTADTALWVMHDITKRKQAEEELTRAKDALEIAHSELQQSLAHEQELARTDGLTGLCNRRYFFELAVREFNAALRYQRPLTIIIFDADSLKRVNDTLGHEVGDKMLLMITQIAAAHVRTVDVLARYGGDEFIILLPQTNAQQAFVIAERIRENVAAACVDTEKDTLKVTISAGVAETIRGSRSESVETVIRRADEALYIAKNGGHNRTVIFNPDEK